jgi:hypothetical protein
MVELAEPEIDEEEVGSQAVDITTVGVSAHV